MKIPISKIGKLQKQDILNSSGSNYISSLEISRSCEVIKDSNAFDDRNDYMPLRTMKLFGGNTYEYNIHYIIQVAGCDFNCPYCYVDNKKIDLYLDEKEIVDDFINMKKIISNINVLHLMGGNPGKYCSIWPLLRNELDSRGLNKIILFSDILFIEHFKYGLTPWKYLDKLHNFILTGGLKGTSEKEFTKNSGSKNFDFEIILNELKMYLPYDNFYVSLTGENNSENLSEIENLVGSHKIENLKIVNYIASKIKEKIKL